MQHSVSGIIGLASLNVQKIKQTKILTNKDKMSWVGYQHFSLYARPQRYVSLFDSNSILWCVQGYFSNRE